MRIIRFNEKFESTYSSPFIERFVGKFSNKQDALVAIQSILDELDINRKGTNIGYVGKDRYNYWVQMYNDLNIIILGNKSSPRKEYLTNDDI